MTKFIDDIVDDVCSRWMQGDQTDLTIDEAKRMLKETVQGTLNMVPSMNDVQARSCACDIENSLCDRRGFDPVFRDVDDDIKEEIMQEMETIILTHVNAARHCLGHMCSDDEVGRCLTCQAREEVQLRKRGS